MMPARALSDFPPDLLPERQFGGVLERLSGCDRAAARRAEQAIGLSLAGTRQSIWPEIAWCTSTLTPGGYPLEFAWSSADPAIRWTAEVAGPEVSLDVRLAKALGILRVLGQPVVLPDVLDGKAGHGNRFGTWLGGRHRGSEDRYKLYLEMATAAGWSLARDLLPETVAAAIPGRTTWRMAGYTPDSGIVEIYGRVAHQEIWEIERLLTRCGLDPEPLVSLTAGLTGLDMGARALPGTTGLSLAIDRSGVVVAGGWFALARHLLGPDRVAARAISDMIACQGWRGDLYAALVADIPGEGTRFGMVGAGVDIGGGPWLQVGYRP